MFYLSFVGYNGKKKDVQSEKKKRKEIEKAAKYQKDGADVSDVRVNMVSNHSQVCCVKFLHPSLPWTYRGPLKM